MKPLNLSERFVPEPNTGCWLWLGAMDPEGYGSLSVGGRVRKAHRFVFEQYRGPIPPGLQLDHLCRNPSCVNPAHLEPVTNRENTLRGTSLAAVNARKTHCKRGHALDGENVYERIRKGRTWRECRACWRRSAVERAALQKAGLR